MAAAVLSPPQSATPSPEPSQSTTQSPASSSRWISPSLLPGNIISLLNPFTSTTTADHNANHSSRPGGSAALLDIASPSRTNSVMFAEPDNRSNSDGGSREGSVVGGEDHDGTTTGRRSRRKNSNPTNRTKTSFSICHPPPTTVTRTKLHRRPRSLLQLHRLSAHARPLPAFEVIPSIHFSVRLNRAVTRVFKARHGLCPNDLVVLRAEKYHASSVTDREDGRDKEEERENAEDAQEEQDVIGLICKGRNGDDSSTGGGKMRIHMAATGKEWEASALANGAYEFVSTDAHGLAETLRWVPKRARDGSKSVLADGTRRFNCSPIMPGSRRHPVVANLSRTALEINDTYRIPDTNSGLVTPTSGTPQQHGPSILMDVLEEETAAAAAAGRAVPSIGSGNGGGRSRANSAAGLRAAAASVAGSGSLDPPCVTDDALREIITVSAIWVAFKEGWSPSFKYDDGGSTNATPLSSPTTATAPNGGSPIKSATAFFSDLAGATPPGSPLLFPTLGVEKRASIKSIGSGIVRRTRHLSRSAQQRGSMHSAEGVVLGEPTDRDGLSSHKGSPTRSTVARGRAESTSTVLVHRVPSVKQHQHRRGSGLRESTGSIGSGSVGYPRTAQQVWSTANGNHPSDLRAAENDLVESRDSREVDDSRRGEREARAQRRRRVAQDDDSDDSSDEEGAEENAGDDAASSMTAATEAGRSSARSTKKSSLVVPSERKFADAAGGKGPKEEKKKKEKERGRGTWRRLLCGSSKKALRD